MWRPIETTIPTLKGSSRASTDTSPARAHLRLPGDDRHSGRRSFPNIAASAGVALLLIGAPLAAEAQQKPAMTAQADTDGAKNPPVARKPTVPRATTPTASSAKPKPASQPEVKTLPANTAAPGGDTELFTKQLRSAQATTCLPAVEGLARASVNGPSEFQVVSNWSKGTPNTRMVNVLIGSKNAGPNGGGMAAIVASPVGPNSCDGYAMQIVANASSCADLQKAAMPELAPTQVAGTTIVGMKDGGQAVLIPAGATSCTLVRVRMFNQP